jgi:hypothetical protein
MAKNRKRPYVALGPLHGYTRAKVISIKSNMLLTDKELLGTSSPYKYIVGPFRTYADAENWTNESVGTIAHRRIGT